MAGDPDKRHCRELSFLNTEKLMYQSYWQLSSRPFENSCDSPFYYPSESHHGALLKLRYVVENRRGGSLLAGGTGIGKTMLIQTLLQQLPETCQPQVHIVFPQMPPDQLLAYVATELAGDSISVNTPTIESSVRRIQSFLEDNVTAGRHAILVIDEAHLLAETGALESIRLLLNFGFDNHPGLTLILVGDPSLLPALNRMPGLEERLGIKCLLRPFQEEETLSYINHRLKAAGCSRPIFTTAAIETVHRLSGGVARKINRLCDLALLIGYAEEQTEIQPSHIEDVSEELVAVQID